MSYERVNEGHSFRTLRLDYPHPSKTAKGGDLIRLTAEFYGCGSAGFPVQVPTAFHLGAG